MSPPVTLDPSQLAAVDLMAAARFGVVTGGPGTGKTTTLRSALDRLDADGATYALAAPTGKAARRMSEATGREARTVHRLLEFGPLMDGSGRMGFARCRALPLEVDAVFVDEASMLDVELAAALVDAVDAARTRLVLIGDGDQLPSVGPGRVFADLISGACVPVARLTTLHRAARESWVCTAAASVLAGEAIDLEPRRDFSFIECDSADAIAPAVVRLLADVMRHERGGTERLPQVLVPQNTGRAGVVALNAAIQAVAVPPGDAEAWKFGETEFRVGDRVICCSNDYERGVMNGEVGRVTWVGKVTTDRGASVRALRVLFEGRSEPVEYTGESVGRLRLAYAITVHRSQGSEWPRVVVVCHSTHSFMLTRQILYTAITRAKGSVVIVGDRAGIRHAIKTTKDTRRNTGLVERIAAYRAAESAA